MHSCLSSAERSVACRKGWVVVIAAVITFGCGQNYSHLFSEILYHAYEGFKSACVPVPDNWETPALKKMEWAHASQRHTHNTS